ncbi:hypothetical protein MNBD_CHLOROFLEXI01-3254 [hydrothermal vent metagenome]|uniref:Uncharacterized protein n=1 Tax=hydrothermal vent metagenome TaxID=652676 RepID=A0A3B0VW89_9ZZZZ
MLLDELIPTVKELPRIDKLRLMQFLATDLAEAEDVEPLVIREQYPVWTPVNAVSAGETLLELLQQHEEE